MSDETFQAGDVWSTPAGAVALVQVDPTGGLCLLGGEVPGTSAVWQVLMLTGERKGRLILVSQALLEDGHASQRVVVPRA